MLGWLAYAVAQESLWSGACGQAPQNDIER